MRVLWSHFSSIPNCKLSPRIRRISAANLKANLKIFEGEINKEGSGYRLFMWLEQREKGQLVLFSPISYELEDIQLVIILGWARIGGARDATNIIESSNLAASVITTIGEEHMAALGGSLESIAEAKIWNY